MPKMLKTGFWGERKGKKRRGTKVMRWKYLTSHILRCRGLPLKGGNVVTENQKKPPPSHILRSRGLPQRGGM